MTDKLLQAAKALYAIPTVYATVWTTIQLACGVAAGYKTDNPTIGFAVAILVTAISKAAREHLAAKRAAKA